jgi:hypothetical protein
MGSCHFPFCEPGSQCLIAVRLAGSGYEAVNAMLLNEFIKAHRQVQEQQKQIDRLTAQLKEQAARIQRVSAQVS